MADHSITEGVSGYHHYHLSAERKGVSLCGKPTMQTQISLKDWRVPFGAHFPKRPTWCDECEKLAAIGGRHG